MYWYCIHSAHAGSSLPPLPTLVHLLYVVPIIHNPMLDFKASHTTRQTLYQEGNCVIGLSVCVCVSNLEYSALCRHVDIRPVSLLCSWSK